MDAHYADLMQLATRALMLGALPLLAIVLPGLVIALLQGMMAIREDSTIYAARAAGGVLILVLFGATIAASLVELMRFALS